MNIKRILISEQEKKSILGLYNVISEQTSTNSYFLGPNQSVKFTVISGKETSDGKELTVDLGLIADFIVNNQKDNMGGIAYDVYSKLTGKLTYNAVDGMVKLNIDKPESIDNKSYENIKKSFGDLVDELVTTGVSIDNAEYFQDEVLVTRLKNIKLKFTDEERCELPNDKKWRYATQGDKWYASKNNIDWFDITNNKKAVNILKTGCKNLKKVLSFNTNAVVTDDDTMAPPTANNVNSQPVDKQQSQPNTTNNNLAVTNKPLDTEIGI